MTYGHVIVDEAQDLSPMQARTLARRCPSGSFTVLGDLAQTTTTWVRDSWSELTEHLASTPAQVLTLSIGYRVPAPVLELAAQQLPLAGPDLTPPRSIRAGRGEPTLMRIEEAGLVRAAVREVANHLEASMTTAAVVADEDFDDWLTTFRNAGLAAGDGRDGDFSQQLTVVPAAGAKGLEFDAVVLVEPGALVRRALQPARALYVAMTRCTQSLTVLHSRALPPGFPAPEHESPEDEAGSTPQQAPDDGVIPQQEATDSQLLAARIQRLSSSDQHLVARLVTRLLRPDTTEDSTDD